MSLIFITGTGTGVGKTLVSAILVQALEADYWKPVQAGLDGLTDSEWVKQTIGNPHSRIHTEQYRLKMAASPHIAAREEGFEISLEAIVRAVPVNGRHLIIEGAGGLMVPLNNHEFVIDLIEKLQARVIIVSRNYLGSINHSMLTAVALRARRIPVLGWVFNDQYLDYAHEIVNWSGFPELASIPWCSAVNPEFIRKEGERIRATISRII